MPASIQENYNKAATTKKVKSPGAQWPGFTIHEISRQAVDQLDTVQLDAVYAQIRPGIESWVVLVCPNHTELYNVDDTVEDAVTDFTMSSKTTRLKLCGENLNEFDNKLRKTIVFAQSEKLEIADAPVLPDGAILVQDAKPCPVQGVQIDLAHPIPLLPAGRTLFITGTNEKTDAVRHEWAVLEKMDPNGATLFLRDSLQRDESQPTGYRRSSVTIYANVARATHGETREEVLGSGDAAQPFQQFALREAPLTYTPATTPSGGCSTLQMRVNEILWDETDTLDGKPAQAHLFTTQEGPDGKPLVHFGDGVTGARLPSGVENISAAYRVGLGAAGNLQAHQLRVLLSGLLGVNAVHNPQPAVGGVDPEAVSAARSNAPYTALTLGRLVSLRDYEDFARAFGGVGKARATWQWNGTRGVVIVTVVAPDGKELNEETAKLLQQAIQAVRDPAQQVKVIKQAASSFTIAARLVIKPAYRADRVKAAADSTLRQAFSLPQRDFGQCVSESDILGVLQTVDGVQAADLTAFSVEVASPDTLLILKEGPDAIRLEAVTDLNTPEMKGGQP